MPSTSASTFTWAKRAYLLTVDGFALARENIMPMIREYNSWKVGGLVTLGVVVLLAMIYFVLVMPVGLRPM